jgi:1-acyl-sn-glycerol-3-phosphate acyltransferase
MAAQWVRSNTLRIRVLNREVLKRPGGYQLACTHLSHVDPFVLGVLARHPVDFMSRIEFYRYAVFAWFLTNFGAIPVRRQGVSANAIREAINRISAGRVVGIFPEGGVTAGAAAACLGGPIKGGVGLIAVRTGQPVIPVVIVGTQALNRIPPWLPFRWGRVWVAFGQPICPPPDPPRTATARRAAADAVTAEVGLAFQQLFQQLVDRFDLDPDRLTDYRSHR